MVTAYVVFSCGLLCGVFMRTPMWCFHADSLNPALFPRSLPVWCFHADSYVVFSCGLLCGVFMQTPMWCFHADSYVVFSCGLLSNPSPFSNNYICCCKRMHRYRSYGTLLAFPVIACKKQNTLESVDCRQFSMVPQPLFALFITYDLTRAFHNKANFVWYFQCTPILIKISKTWGPSQAKHMTNDESGGGGGGGYSMSDWITHCA